MASNLAKSGEDDRAAELRRRVNEGTYGPRPEEVAASVLRRPGLLALLGCQQGSISGRAGRSRAA